MKLAGRVAVVTGGAGLIGSAHSHALAAEGAEVVVADIDGDRAAEVAGSLPGAAIGAVVDVTEPDSVCQLRQQVIDTYGRLDVLVNDAAINDMVERPASAGVAFEDYPLDSWNRSLSVNLTGTFLTCQVLGSWMAAHAGGSVVNIASTYALVAPDQRLYRQPNGHQTFWKSPAYPATKGAILSLTRYLAAYWGERGVRVNALTPGGVENGQDRHFIDGYSIRTPLGRMATAEDYAAAIVFLASDDSAYMTGSNLVIDGGWTAW